MSSRVTSLLSLLLLVSAGCATPPPPRTNPDLSVIGASVKIAAPLWRHPTAEYAYFVRLDDGEPPLRALPIRSNFSRSGYVFLFNARPGRYALVLCLTRHSTQRRLAPLRVSFDVSE